MSAARRFGLVVLVVIAVASACGGDDGGSGIAPDGGAEAGVEGNGSSGGGDCSLLTNGEIEAATGVAPTSSEVPAIGGGCTWFIDGDVVLVALDIGDDATIIDGEPGSRFESTLDRHEASSIESTDIDGIADAANESGAPVPNNIIVLQGDEFLELTVNETGQLGAGTVQDLMVTVIGRR